MTTDEIQLLRSVLSEWNQTYLSLDDICNATNLLTCLSINKITFLNISGGHLDLGGQISPRLGSATSLIWLDLAHNRLKGNIPSELGQLFNLQKLDLSGNSLRGQLPLELGQLAQVQTLALSRNWLTGRIPSEYGKLGNLVVIGLNSLWLKGRIPTEFGLLPFIGSIQLARNKLSGAIPAAISKLDTLQSLALDSNRFSGELSSDLGQLRKLVSFSMYYNWLTGSIPTELTKLVYVHSFYVNDNHLEGSIPSTLSNMAALWSIHMEGNSLTGRVPLGLGKLKNMQKLHLGSNRLCGSIPSDIGVSTPRLQRLTFERNKLTGPIPEQLGDLSSVYQLGLNNNLLSGTLPNLSRMTGLQDLFLARNQLKGSIAKVLPSGVGVVDLSFNSFTGCPDLGSLPYLKILLLHSNGFSGRFPELVGVGTNRSSLVVLAHGNFFSGYVPSTGPNNLKFVLAVPGNILHAPIPPWFKDPFVGKHGKSSLVSDSIEDVTSLLIIPLFLLVASYAILRLMYRHAPLAAHVKGVFVGAVIGHFIKLCAGHSLFAFVLAAVFVFVDKQRYEYGRQLSIVSAGYATGNAILIAGVLWILQACWTFVQIETMPFRPVTSQQVHCERAGHKEERIKSMLRWRTIVSTWMVWICIMICCEFPVVYNAYIVSSPMSGWALQIRPFLPALAMLSTSVFLPLFSALISAFFRRGLFLSPQEKGALSSTHLLLLAGFGTWLVPVFITVFLSENCYGGWWSELPACRKRNVHICRERPDDREHFCDSSGMFDACSGYHWNGTVYDAYCLMTTEQICADRWLQPHRCTMAVIDALGPFLMGKVLLAGVVPIAALLAFGLLGSNEEPCRCLRLSPIWIFRKTVVGSKPEILLRVYKTRRRIKDKNVAEFFNPQHTLQRVAVWTDIGLAWGPAMPAISIATLIYVCVEGVCSSIAYENYYLGPDYGRTVYLHWYTLVGMCFSYCLLALHALSNSSFQHFIFLCCLSAVCATILLSGFFKKFSREVWESPTKHLEHEGVELAELSAESLNENDNLECRQTCLPHDTQSST